MCIRPVIAFLLMVALMVAAVGRTRARLDDSPAQTNDTQLAPDEEWEARSLAQQFARRFEESDDPLAIVDDFYVKDFDERLRHDPAERFIIPVASDFAEQVKGGELRRYHIAWQKFIYLYLMLSASALRDVINLKGGAKPDEDEKGAGPDDILPPRVIALFKSDPALAEALLEETKKDDGSENGSEMNAAPPDNGSEKMDDDRDLTIKSMERLRSLISTLEQAIVIMRERLRTLPVPQTWQNMMDSLRQLGADFASDPTNPRAYVLTHADFGSPKGTRLICLKVSPYHMDLIRVDGQLKILYAQVAGD
jgi:hypothetical protein